MGKPVGMIFALKILRDFGAKEAPSYRVLGVAAETESSSRIVDVNHD
jgi:S-adenosylmethionine hydrolase